MDDFRQFTKDVKAGVDRMLPTGGRRYNQAAVPAIDFSDSDIPGLVPPWNELLDLLNRIYEWSVETHTIDCTKHCKDVEFSLNAAVLRSSQSTPR